MLGVQPELVRKVIEVCEYYQDGGSEKHLRDILAMLQVSGSAIDREYIEQWSSALTFSEIWRTVLLRLNAGD